jgi:hypothetical protein
VLVLQVQEVVTPAPALRYHDLKRAFGDMISSEPLVCPVILNPVHSLIIQQTEQAIKGLQKTLQTLQDASSQNHKYS